jgi:hypothetical protein
MQFTFLPLKSNNDLDIQCINSHGEEGVMYCFLENGRVIIPDYREFDVRLSDREVELLDGIVNTAYLNQVVNKKRKRSAHRINDASNHWWVVLPEHRKIELITGLEDKLIGFVDALLDKNPKDIKRQHYASLIRRSQLTALQVDGYIESKKLRKLPKYDAVSGRLHGTIRSFIALAEVCYPAKKYKESHVGL